ncbi:hypothetical protein Aple_098290 [Acrocarpospora pleiomorpha]|uniref:DUF402 domain-containing protein n=1 Tax=Acrocarpospora pleiomorpha TaxID=90975 RepID=A0A5M3Y105_9ACTN|nr:DUF402 domain-containing protein [Acrocarpospora pleiomorpha]GES26930.1 hypothetical protein Aple_098290 [Acrocarpospora pleiomorpha]
MSGIEVVYRKYGGTLHWNHPARRLGEDEHGVWAGCPAGTIGRLGEGPPVVWKLPFVLLFPRDTWWTATFNPIGHKMAIYCDITTVPEWRDGEVTMVDLDLDVIKRADGTVFLDDVDEFAEHQVWLEYPLDVIENAELSATWLMTAVAQGTGPFGGAHTHWLDQVS